MSWHLGNPPFSGTYLTSIKIYGKKKLRVKMLWYEKDRGWNGGLKVMAWDYLPEPYVPGQRVIYDGYKELELLERQRKFDESIRAAMSAKAERFKDEILHGKRNDGDDRPVVQEVRDEREHGARQNEEGLHD